MRPGFLPAGQKTPWNERLSALKDIWATLLLFAFVIGGLYGGLFTATEAAGAGAGGAFLIGIARRKLSGADILRSLLETTRTAAAVFTILIGALLFGYFLTITQTPQKVTTFLTGLGIGSYGVLTLIMPPCGDRRPRVSCGRCDSRRTGQLRDATPFPYPAVKAGRGQWLRLVKSRYRVCSMSAA